jgi:uncharacterized PurR-regulated membrane protein YhhQ (DUF165 family)
MPLNVLWQIFATTVILKTIISLIDTPFVYLGVLIHKNRSTKENVLAEAN